ncbi:uncharacterized protein LOC106873201 [Octopus bimaculoides]|uniref:uncharacterized protein LOC106873201 n=1 Tax=Octopus bimaculoides TaxID=37653 RepID=UPI00071E08EA|nr:uncharacterized protein LOC106873201 [Octopus bimaculoides]|eukprot:XP_014775927.1 PREDICTED: uncharacterized protein LOC106873201 [Octopus bimaculoides]
MRKIRDVIHQINPYAELYKNIHAVEQREEERARRVNVSIRRYEFRFRRGSDIRRYNFPTSNEIAVVFVRENGVPPENRDIIVYPRDAPSEKISYMSCHLDPMSYPILFSPGEFGWHCEMQHIVERRTRLRNRLTMQEYYSYRLAFRDGFSVIHRAGKLFQQYVVDAYVKVESCRLQYLRNNQTQLRVERYNGFMDYLNTGADENIESGVPVILPSSFTGSPRNMNQYFQDAMSIVSKYTKPDLFITYTCNLKRPKIVDNLQQNRPDLVARVYKSHLAERMRDIRDRHIVGSVEK